METLCLRCCCFFHGDLEECPRECGDEVVAIDRSDPHFVRRLTDGPLAERLIRRFDERTQDRLFASRARDDWYFTHLGGKSLWMDVSLNGVGLFRFNPATREVRIYES
ncbi:MAG: hypothetical protein ACRDHM_11780 [Actinomycetota bacterium]